jgi:hypothetical protein
MTASGAVSAGPSRKWRADDGVALLDLQIVQCGLIRLDRADQNIGLGFGIIEVDLRGGALADQIAVTPDIALRAFKLGLILGEHALGLLDLGVDLTRVEGKQQIAFIDLGAVFEVDRDDGGFDPRFQRHAGNRRHRPDRIDIDRHRLAFRLGQFDRDHARALRSLGTGAAAGPGRTRHEGSQSNDAQPACQKDQITFFHNILRQPTRNHRDDPAFCPVTAAFAPYF